MATPFAGADVEAFDADWLQDDALGAATTDADGRFRIYYTRHDFEKTIFPFINIELFDGPDVYFVVKFNGVPTLTEGQAQGRSPGRENAHTCPCVELCTDNLPHTPPEARIPSAATLFTSHPTRTAGSTSTGWSSMSP